MKILSLEDMEELLTDYAFGKLSENEANIFEENLVNYPNLEKEIIDIRSTFSKVNKEVIKDNLHKKTSNISYKVKQKQYEANKNHIAKKNILKFVIPILVLGAIYLILRDMKLNETVSNINTNEEVIISSADLNIILGDKSHNNSISNISSGFIINDNLSLLNFTSNTNIYSYMNDMSETEFNQLLNEIENENFNL